MLIINFIVIHSYFLLIMLGLFFVPIFINNHIMSDTLSLMDDIVQKKKKKYLMLVPFLYNVFL